VGKPILEGDLLGPEYLAKTAGVEGAVADGGSVGADHALDALDHADPTDDAGAGMEIALGGREGHELEEGRVAIEQELDALARGQLSAPAMALDVALAAASAGVGEQLLDGVEVSSIASRLA